MAGATGKAAAQVKTRSGIPGRDGLAGGFFVFTQSTAPVPGGALPETTMTKRIGPSLKDFTRRDFLVSSALTAVLFAAAYMLFPVDAKILGKSPK